MSEENRFYKVPTFLCRGQQLRFVQNICVPSVNTNRLTIDKRRNGSVTSIIQICLLSLCQLVGANCDHYIVQNFGICAQDLESIWNSGSFLFHFTEMFQNLLFRSEIKVIKTILKTNRS